MKSIETIALLLLIALLIILIFYIVFNFLIPALINFLIEYKSKDEDIVEKSLKDTQKQLESIRSMIDYFENSKHGWLDDESIKKIESRIVSLKKVEEFLVKFISQMNQELEFLRMSK